MEINSTSRERPRLKGGALHRDLVAGHGQARALYRNVGTVNSITAVGLCELGTIVALQGDTERAVALCEECISLCQAHGEQWARAWGLLHLTIVRWLRGDLEQVSVHAKEALQLKHALNDQPGIAWCVEMLGWVAAAKGDAKRAAVLFGMGDTLWVQIGQWLGTWQAGRDMSNRLRSQARKTLGQRAFEAAFERGQCLAGDEAIAYALDEQPAPPAPATIAPGLSQLTPREQEVAKLIAKGMSNRDIAATLVIAGRTAEAHVEHILTKLGFTYRTQIAAWIIEQQAS